MPFSSTPTHTEQQWTGNFEHMFRPAFTEIGYTCERAAPMTGALAESIVAKLNTASIVLADVTDRNPNVFYELGIRHALRRGTIVIAQGHQHIPSDLGGQWYLRYVPDPAGIVQFKAEIKRLVAAIEQTARNADNPVASYLDKEDAVISRYQVRDSLNKLSALLTELTGNMNVLKTLSSFPWTSKLLRTGCLRLLCDTRYVATDPNILSEAYELASTLTQLEFENRYPDTIVRATEACQQLFHKLQSFMAMLASGAYEEPTSITYLEWRLSSTASPRVGVRFFNPDIDPKPFITQLAEAQAEVVHESVHAFGSVVIDQMLPFRPSWEAGQDDLTWLAAPKRQSTPHIPKAGWNKPCPCGSGKKYKNCCRR